MTWWSHSGSRDAPSTMCTRIRVRSTWRRNAWPRPGAGAGALDEPGDVGDRRPALILVAEVHDAQVRLERRERVIGDLRLGGRQRREQRGLAGVRQADQADVGDEPELEAQPGLRPGLALLGVPRRLVGGRLEVRVAEAAATPARDHRPLPDRDEIGEQLPGVVAMDGGPGRDGQARGRRPPCRDAALARRGHLGSP